MKDRVLILLGFLGSKGKGWVGEDEDHLDLHFGSSFWGLGR